MSEQTTVQTAGGLGIGVVQPQSGLDYPFVSPGSGIQTSAVADVENLFADFYLSYDDPGYYNRPALVVNPLRVYWLYGFGSGTAWSAGAAPDPGIPVPAPTHTADLVVVDSAGVVVFDSTTADHFTVTQWGEYYSIYEWHKTTKPNEAVCRVVKYDKVHNTLELPIRPSEYCPRNAVLDERTIEKIPKRVLAMRVQNGECITPWFKEKVSLVNGHNTEINIGATEILSLRRTTAITFTATPGSGRGQYGLCPTGICEEDTPTNVCPAGEDPVVTICSPIIGEEIKSINGVKPKSGNVFITASDCVWVRKPAAYTGNTPHNYALPEAPSLRAAIAIGADCPPCCDCADYLDVAQYMRRLGAYYHDVGSRVADIRNLHDSNIDRWETQRECRHSRPFNLILVPQPCPCMDVILFYCNHSDVCAENVMLTVQFTAEPGVSTAQLDTKYSRIVADNRSNQATISGGWPVFSARFSTVTPGASTYAQFRLCFCPQHPYLIRGTLTGTSSRGPIRAGLKADAPPAIVVAGQVLDCEPLPTP